MGRPKSPPKTSHKPRAQAKPGPKGPKITQNVPKDLADASSMVAHMRVHAKERDKIQKKRDAEIAKLEERINALQEAAHVESQPLEEQIFRIAGVVRDYVETNREQLTKNGKAKSVRFLLRDVAKWTKSRYVHISEAELPKFLDEAIKLERYDLISMEPNKKAIAVYLEDGTLDYARMSEREWLNFVLTGVTDRVSINTSDEKAEWLIAPPKNKK